MNKQQFYSALKILTLFTKIIIIVILIITIMIIFIETTFSCKYGFQRGSHKIKNTKYTLNSETYKISTKISESKSSRSTLKNIFTFADCLAKGVKILNGMVIACLSRG